MNQPDSRSIWTAKFTVCEFLKRLSGMHWRRSIQLFMRFIHYFLASTLLAVLIATLAECQPFDHYWQVIPDPGTACRSGYANLITMGTCDVITDLILIAFPIPIIIMGRMSLKRKAFLVSLFALSLVLVAITCFRVPSVIQHHGSQQYRSLLASLEILAATAVSNILVIGSFVRDKGVKKLKFKKALASASASENMDQNSVRRATVTHHQWGSDSDLAADLGIRLEPKLYHGEGKLPRPAPTGSCHPLTVRAGGLDPNWSFKRHSMGSDDSKMSGADSIDIKVSPHEYIETNKSSWITSSSSRRVSFQDPGGLLDPGPEFRQNNAIRGSEAAALDPRSGSLTSSTYAPITRARSSPTSTPSPNFSRPSGTPGRTNGNGRRGSTYSTSSLDSAPSYRPDVSAPIIENEDVELQDVGGLLSRDM